MAEFLFLGNMKRPQVFFKMNLCHLVGVLLFYPLTSNNTLNQFTLKRAIILVQEAVGEYEIIQMEAF